MGDGGLGSSCCSRKIADGEATLEQSGSKSSSSQSQTRAGRVARGFIVRSVLTLETGACPDCSTGHTGPEVGCKWGRAKSDVCSGAQGYKKPSHH